MSVTLMSLVFKCNMPELKTDKGQTVPDSTAKFVLLALADHANDEGEGAYPSVKKICKKTNFSTATVINALNALRTNEFTKLVGRSKRETYNYTISVAKIAAFQWLESDDSSGQNGGVSAAEIKPSPNPPRKPSKNKEGASAKPAKPAEPKATDIPELVIFREVVEHWPRKFQRPAVIESVQKVGARLGRDVTAADLAPFWTAWGKVSGNEWSLVWLTEWAVNGRVNGNGRASSQPSPSPVVPPDELARMRAEMAEHARQHGGAA